MTKGAQTKTLMILACAFTNKNNSISGGDVIAKDISNEFNDNGYRVLWVSNKIGCDYISKESQKTEPIRFFEWFDWFFLPISYVLRTVAAVSIIIKKKPELILCSSDFFPDVIPAAMYKLFWPSTRRVQLVHHLYPDWKIRAGNKIKNFLAQNAQKLSLRLSKNSDLIICVDRNVRDKMLKMRFAPNKIEVVHLGVDLEIISETLASTVHSNKCLKCVFVGRLHPTKGIYDLPEIFNEIVKVEPKTKLYMIGNGPEAIINDLKFRIIELGLTNNIILITTANDAQKYKHLGESAVFMFPSYEEGYGIAILEALAAECEVVAWNLDSYNNNFPNLLHTVDIGEKKLMAQKTLQLLRINKKNIISNERRDFINSRSIEKMKKSFFNLIVE